MDRTAHWEQVYRTKSTDQVSWFQAEATLSLTLIQRLTPERTAPIVDIGAGASVLVARYSPSALQAELGDGFAMMEAHRELHTTPSGATQAFTVLVSRKES